jgi:hypothetical protein
MSQEAFGKIHDGLKEALEYAKNDCPEVEALKLLQPLQCLMCGGYDVISSRGRKCTCDAEIFPSQAQLQQQMKRIFGDV